MIQLSGLALGIVFVLGIVCGMVISIGVVAAVSLIDERRRRRMLRGDRW